MLDFPNSPAVGDIFTTGTFSWRWDGAKWVVGSSGGSGYVAKAGDTMLGPLGINGGNPFITLNKSASGESANIYSNMNGKTRWIEAFGDATAESGANAGSNFAIYRCDDGGLFIDAALSISRSTGIVNAPAGLMEAGIPLATKYGLPVGTILLYAGYAPPTGWYLCNGQNLIRSANPLLTNLFANTTPAFPYGTLDAGSFMVPDLRGRVPVGQENMGGWGSPSPGRLISGYTGGVPTDILGGVGGEAAHSPIAAELTNHSHGHNHGPQGGGNFARIIAGGANSLPAGSNTNPQPTTDTDATGVASMTSTPANVAQPSLLLTFIIKGG